MTAVMDGQTAARSAPHFDSMTRPSRGADVAFPKLMQIPNRQKIIIPLGLGLRGFTNVAAQRELTNYLD